LRSAFAILDAPGGICGVPATARAVVVNVTVAIAGGDGHFKMYPDGVIEPNASTLNFLAGQTRGNKAVVKVTNRVFTIKNNSAGSNHVIVDVMGYVQ
jgi:hypothetical protein